MLLEEKEREREFCVPGWGGGDELKVITTDYNGW